MDAAAPDPAGPEAGGSSASSGRSSSSSSASRQSRPTPTSSSGSSVSTGPSPLSSSAGSSGQRAPLPLRKSISFAKAALAAVSVSWKLCSKTNAQAWSNSFGRASMLRIACATQRGTRGRKCGMDMSKENSPSSVIVLTNEAASMSLAARCKEHLNGRMMDRSSGWENAVVPGLTNTSLIHGASSRMVFRKSADTWTGAASNKQAHGCLGSLLFTHESRYKRNANNDCTVCQWLCVWSTKIPRGCGPIGRTLSVSPAYRIWA